MFTVLSPFLEISYIYDHRTNWWHVPNLGLRFHVFSQIQIYLSQKRCKQNNFQIIM